MEFVFSKSVPLVYFGWPSRSRRTVYKWGSQSFSWSHMFGSHITLGHIPTKVTGIHPLEVVVLTHQNQYRMVIGYIQSVLCRFYRVQGLYYRPTIKLQTHKLHSEILASLNLHKNYSLVLVLKSNIASKCCSSTFPYNHVCKGRWKNAGLAF